MSKVFKLSLLTIFIIPIALFCAKVSAETAGYKLILFYTSWSYNSREAKQNVSALESTYAGRIKFQTFDVDLPTTPEKAAALNIDVPNVVPYIYILDKKGQIVSQKVYKNESTQELKQYVDKYINK